MLHVPLRANITDTVRRTASTSAPGLPLDVTPTAPDPPPASAALACHVSQYLTRTDTYLSILVLFIISVSLYISPYPQEDPYPFLFGSPASTASHPTAVAFTVGKDPPREPTSETQHVLEI